MHDCSQTHIRLHRRTILVLARWNQPRRPFWVPVSALLLLSFLALSVIVSAGCGKRNASNANPPVGQATDSALQPVSANSAVPVAGVTPVALAENGDAPAQLSQLTQLVRRFGMEHQKVPQSLNELVAARYLAALPAAPAGKQFVIDAKHMQVVLE
jgi:hypothetical protein